MITLAQLPHASREEAEKYFEAHIERRDRRRVSYEQFKRDINERNHPENMQIYDCTRGMITAWRKRWGKAKKKEIMRRSEKPIVRYFSSKRVSVGNNIFKGWNRPRGMSGYLKKSNPKVRFGGHVFWTRDDRVALDTSEGVVVDRRDSRRAGDMDALSRLHLSLGGHL